MARGVYLNHRPQSHEPHIQLNMEGRLIHYPQKIFAGHDVAVHQRPAPAQKKPLLL